MTFLLLPIVERFGYKHWMDAQRNKSSALELKAEGTGEDFSSKHAVPSGNADLE